MSTERDNFRISCAFATILAIITAQFDCVNGTNSSEFDEIYFRLYGNSLGNYVDEYVGNAASLVPLIDRSRPTTFFCHGWRDSVMGESNTLIAAAYLSRGDHNYIAIDYSRISKEGYVSAASSVRTAGIVIANAIKEMLTNGLDYTTIHLIGHSLGAQLVGAIGRNMGLSLPRITGLDPAGPGFYFLEVHLMASDAAYVDIIHTDIGVYGNTDNGISNFYPNGGFRLQTGCPAAIPPFDGCSHSRSYQYYAESVRNEGAFLGVLCPSKSLFLVGLCSGNQQAVMGYAVSRNTYGNYYLATNPQSPYGRGQRGIGNLFSNL